MSRLFFKGLYGSVKRSRPRGLHGSPAHERGIVIATRALNYYLGSVSFSLWLPLAILSLVNPLGILSPLFKRVRCIQCDLSIALRSALARIAPRSVTEQVFSAFLSRQVRAVPWWVRGHILVCRLLIKQAEIAPLSAKDSATLRWTAEAARRLMSSHSSLPNTRYWEAETVWAKAQMIEKRFALAFECYKNVVGAGAVFLTQRDYFLALEDAAACALIVGGVDESAALLRRIPEQYKTAAARSVS